MNRTRLLLPALVLAGASILATAPASAGGRPLTASLAGANEVPGPGLTGGTGSATVTLNQGEGEICFEINSNVTSPTAAHIHEAPFGMSGPVVVPLTFVIGQPLVGCVSAGSALIKEIRKNPADYYVNVHNATFGAGAVRGQLAP